jgi:transcriptional regulator with XRE-family HTH domain
MDILKTLVNERRAKKVKAKQIADFIGMSPSLFSRLETGKSIPNINYIEQFADYLGYEIRLLKK